MSDQDDTIAGTFPRLVAVGRRAAAIVVAGVVAALAWLFVLQEGHTGNIFGARWTQHDFADGLGLAFGAKDTAKGGLYLTLALGVAVAALYAGVERGLPGRAEVKGLAFAPVLFLAWGLVFTPLVDSRQVLRDADFVYLPTGFFGSGAGGKTVFSGIAASVIAAVLIARVFALMRDASWWREHPNVGHGLGGERASALLELTEERPEQGVEGPR
jgi:hypothetical protein